MSLTDAAAARRQTLLPIVLLLLWFAATAWFRPLTAPDEGRYVGAAMEMLRSGDWLVPRIDGLPFFHKPPLFYWLSAASMALFGSSEWAARLPSLLGATAAAASLYLFVRRWVGNPMAKYVAWVLATMPFFYIGAQFANLDMLVAGCITATLLLAVHAALLREQGQVFCGFAAGAFAMAALGVLSKGLIGILLPGAVFLLWCLATRRARSAWLLAWPSGWLIFLLTAMPWFVLMQLRFPDFFDYFVVTQHFRRFAESGFNNSQPIWFYLPVMAALTLPWFGWLPLAARAASRARVAFSDVDWLMAIWLAVIVVFFSLPHSKLIGYVLPAVPPLAYFVVRLALKKCAASNWSHQGIRWTAVVAACVCVVSVGVAGVFGVSIGTQLRLPAGMRIDPNDRVLMLDSYEYDIPFYWKLQQPVGVVSDWTPAAAGASDNWRKELFDAGQFDPPRRDQVLLSPQDALMLLCRPGTTWLIGDSDNAWAKSWLGGAPPVANSHSEAVWHLWRQVQTVALWRHVQTEAGSQACRDGMAQARAVP